ncbi:FOG: Transposon-encoded proteins with TYA, reverse transcriptase, integrase domains in various combinations [Phaffia rhodozyma]|uniref:FOG: Transposon-encoded proteins with TYA, reverse transcriptase, integrase domains in various combinations n=1 Tax=Phaffia rhodozyma TaxID=264483 RepID=A0A0F7SYQ6_PHARH|nr:FOG: Transposon-encoded proteins with TYA, reverse transcriptase, integrase domains in various combinations [Phaffia rhodozyma]
MPDPILSTVGVESTPSEVSLYRELRSNTLSNIIPLPAPHTSQVNYKMWERRLESALFEMRLWDLVSGVRSRPNVAYPKAQAAWDLDDQIARNFIISVLTDSEGERISECLTAHKQIEVLRSVHMQQGTVGVFQVLSSVWNIRSETAPSLQSHVDHIGRQLHLTEQIAGKTMTYNELYALILIRSLPTTAHGQSFVASLPALAGNDALGHPNPLTYEFVSGAILRDKQLRNTTRALHNSRESTSALAVTPSSPQCSYCGDFGHFAKACPDNPISQTGRKSDSKYKAKKFCDFHKSSGHNTSECYARDRLGSGKGTPRPQANSLSARDPDENDQTYAHSIIPQNLYPSFTFLLDSGCTQTCVSDRSLFSTYETYSDELFVANGASLSVVGKGTVKVVSKSSVDGQDIDVLLSNVWHVPKLSSTILVSLGQICDVDGITFSGNKK